MQHFEPALHLERLKEMPVLLVNDLNDHLVTRPCIEALHRAAPAAATFRLVESGHVRPGNAELIAEMTDLVLAWSDTLAMRAGSGREDERATDEGAAISLPRAPAGETPPLGQTAGEGPATD